MAIHGQHISSLSGQDVADGHLATACLVEHLNEETIAKGGLARYLESGYIVNNHIVSDVVMRDAVPYPVNDDAITDGTVDQLRMS